MAMQAAEPKRIETVFCKSDAPFGRRCQNAAALVDKNALPLIDEENCAVVPSDRRHGLHGKVSIQEVSMEITVGHIGAALGR
jgi:hypothetical protein